MYPQATQKNLDPLQTSQPSDKMPCYYYPTQVLTVDDNPKFLQALKQFLSHSFSLVQTEFPQQALQLLNQNRNDLNHDNSFTQLSDLGYKEQSDYIKDYSDHDDPSLSHQIDFKLNIDYLPSFVKKQAQLKPFSVAVVDYNMPEMDGLTLISQIKDPNIKKIMLTANEDQSIAIDAFNKGLIDYFIAKGDGRIGAKLSQIIMQLQQRYFDEQSDPIYQMIGLSPSTRQVMKHPQYLNLFQQLDRTFRSDFANYYYFITDQFGGYCFHNNERGCERLVIEHEQFFADKCSLLESLDAPQAFINAVANKHQMLCLPDQKSCQQPVHTWRHFLYEATPILNGYYGARVVETRN